MGLSEFQIWKERWGVLTGPAVVRIKIPHLSCDVRSSPSLLGSCECLVQAKFAMLRDSSNLFGVGISCRNLL